MVSEPSKEALCLHTLNLLPELGPTRLKALKNRFENFSNAFSASFNDFIDIGFEKTLAEKITTHLKQADLEKEVRILSGENINLLPFWDERFPELLLEIPKFPALLYYKGIMEEPDELCVACVGTRMISNYGRIVTPNILDPLIDAGVTIVSGMAYGVDALAHQRTIERNKRTIAVLGGGLDSKSIYPRNHALLAERILECGGAIVSEYPPGTPNFKQHFVARNRIISGLSVGTIVIECDLQSGTLITAKHALDQNRAVYAVPGPIYSETSKGPNNLIKMGAKLITEAKDILDDLNLENLPEAKQNQMIFGDSPAETAVIKILSFEPLHIDELVKQSGLEAGEVSSTLVFLEMKGKVRNLGGQQYILSR